MRSITPARPITRIVALGDSTTFGMGVCANATYASHLERAFSNVEVLNFGVIGFTAFQRNQLWQGRAADYQPHIVTVAFGAVDELLPAIDYDVDAKFALTCGNLALLRTRASRFRLFQLVDYLVGPKASRPTELAIRTERNHAAWESGSKEYLRNQSLSSFEQSLRSIAVLARNRGARIMFIIPPTRNAVGTRWPWSLEYIDCIKRVAEEIGAPIADVRTAFRKVADADTRLFFDDYHPNDEGHRLYGRVLRAEIQTLIQETHAS